MAFFLAARTGHNWSYSSPFGLVPSRIDSSKCPLENRVLGFQYIFLWHKTLQNDLKRPKNLPKGSNTYQNDPKMMPKRCQNGGNTWAFCEHNLKKTLYFYLSPVNIDCCHVFPSLKTQWKRRWKWFYLTNRSTRAVGKWRVGTGPAFDQAMTLLFARCDFRGIRHLSLLFLSKYDEIKPAFAGEGI